jgi:hypothetical protein
MEHKRGNEACIILHRGARSRGYKRREREREGERERVRSCGEVPELASAASLLLSLPSLVPFSLRVFVHVSRARLPVRPPCLPTCVRPCVSCPSPHSSPLSLSVSVGRPWTSPFIDTRGWPSYTMGCSYVLTWLAEECLEPCTCANVAVGEVP